MSNLSIPNLVRPAFFNGQLLSAADLTLTQQYDQQLRWLHNRSLHNWGIALGFAVSGSRGDTTVLVQAGYALDCLGRELILEQGQTMAIPAVSGDTGGNPITYYLTVSYACDSALTPVTQQGICGASGAVRYPETPTVRWQNPSPPPGSDPSSSYRRGLDIVLASIQVQNCQLYADISPLTRRDALPAQQPYVFAGQTGTGQTWQCWPAQGPVGISTTVNTSQAGFSSLPAYQANVVGPRCVTTKNYPGGSGLPFYVDGYVQVANPTPSSFDLCVLLPVGATTGPTSLYTITWADAQSVAQAIAADNPNTWADGLMHFTGGSFEVGATITDDRGNVLATPIASEFTAALTSIATRNATSVDILLTYNNMTTNTVLLSAGAQWVVPGNPLELNPPQTVLSQGFLTNFIDMNWSVVWSGVEGS